MPTAIPAQSARRSRGLDLPRMDVPLLASEAAVDLDNYRTGVRRELESIKVLVDILDPQADPYRPVGKGSSSKKTCAGEEREDRLDFSTADILFRAISYSHYGREMADVYKEPAIPGFRTVGDVERELDRVVRELRQLLDYAEFDAARSIDARDPQLKLDLLPSEPEGEKLLRLSKFCIGLSRACLADLSRFRLA